MTDRWKIYTLLHSLDLWWLCTAIGLHIARRQLTMAPRHTCGGDTRAADWTGLGEICGANGEFYRYLFIILDISIGFCTFLANLVNFSLFLTKCALNTVPPVEEVLFIRRTWTTSIKTHRVQTLHLWDKTSFAHLQELIFPTESPMNFINRKQEKIIFNC